MLKGSSQYGGARTFIDHAAAACARRGLAVQILDVAGLEDPMSPLIAAAAKAATDFVFSINMLGEARDGLGRSLAQIFQAPHVVWHVDYILSQDERLEATPADTALLTVDPTQVEAVASIFGPARFPHLGFCPHAAVGRPAADDEDPQAFSRARPIPLLWSGGLQRPGDAPWAKDPGPARKVFDDAVDLALSVEWMAPHLALDAVLKSRGLDLADPAHRGARKAATLVDTRVRLIRRYDFIKALAKTGLPIRICGAGWDSDLYRFKRATYEGPVPMTRMAELMAQSQIVLNTNGNFGAGSHERPFSTMLAGAASVSDFSSFYGEVLEDGRDLMMFRWRDLAGGLAALAELSADAGRIFQIARAGKAKALAGHTWDSRIEVILAAAQAVRAANGLTSPANS